MTRTPHLVCQRITSLRPEGNEPITRTPIRCRRAQLTVPCSVITKAEELRLQTTASTFRLEYDGRAHTRAGQQHLTDVLDVLREQREAVDTDLSMCFPALWRREGVQALRGLGIPNLHSRVGRGADNLLRRRC